MSRVSVIIPNLNGLRLLDTCFGALWQQAYRDFEVIMVDDASTDSSIEWTREHYPEIRIIRLPKTSGLAIACNSGAAVAKGEILVMLNNDTEVEPGWLQAIVVAMDEDPCIGAVASKMLLFHQRDTLHTTGDMVGRDGIPRNRGVWEKDLGQYDTRTEIFGACGGSAAYRRAAWEAVGGFEESFFMYLEDVDLAWRLQLQGWKAKFAPQARVYHYLSATGGGPIASFHTGRNSIRVIVRNTPSAVLRKYWTRIVRSQTKVAIDAVKALRGISARARLRGQVAGLLDIPRLLPERSRILANMRVSAVDIERLLVE